MRQVRLRCSHSHWVTDWLNRQTVYTLTTTLTTSPSPAADDRLGLRFGDDIRAVRALASVAGEIPALDPRPGQPVIQLDDSLAVRVVHLPEDVVGVLGLTVVTDLRVVD